MFRFDDSHPRYSIAYDGAEDSNIAIYQAMLNRWVTRCHGSERFGVILVTEIHDHDEHEHERDVAFEEAFTKLMNDFRRDHKTTVERSTVGYARVVPAAWLESQLQSDPDYLTNAQVATDRMARYMWGIPGSFFGSVEEAQAWLDEQFDKESLTPVAESIQFNDSQRVGLFYGSTTGVTELAAEYIQQAWAALGMEPLIAQNIGVVKDLSALLNYDYLILGIPTWNVGQLQDDWEIALPQLTQLDLTGKRVALFGIGDQYGYPDNFLDAVGILGQKLIERGAELVGLWDTDDYEFAESKALLNGKFMGLALDEVNQPAQTQERVNRWTTQIIHEFALQTA